MRIIIHSVTTDLLVQTVSITENKQDPDNSYLFRCIRCGNAISRIKGSIVDIVPELLPTFDVPVIHECPQCHENYIFHTVNTNRKKTNLILSTDPIRSSTVFRCFVCRTPLLEYTDRILATFFDKQLLPIPTAVTCTKYDCKKEYWVSDIISV